MSKEPITAEKILEIAARRLFVRGHIRTGPNDGERHVVIFLLVGKKVGTSCDESMEYQECSFEFICPANFNPANLGFPNQPHRFSQIIRDRADTLGWLAHHFSRWRMMGLNLFFRSEETLFTTQKKPFNSAAYKVSMSSMETILYLSRMHAVLWQARDNIIKHQEWAELIYRRMDALIGKQMKSFSAAVAL